MYWSKCISDIHFEPKTDCVAENVPTGFCYDSEGVSCNLCHTSVSHAVVFLLACAGASEDNKSTAWYCSVAKMGCSALPLGWFGMGNRLLASHFRHFCVRIVIPVATLHDKTAARDSLAVYRFDPRYFLLVDYV